MGGIVPNGKMRPAKTFSGLSPFRGIGQIQRGKIKLFTLSKILCDHWRLCFSRCSGQVMHEPFFLSYLKSLSNKEIKTCSLLRESHIKPGIDIFFGKK